MNNVPVECYQGADFYLPVLYLFEVCGIDYPQEITGYTAKMDIRYAADQANPPLLSIAVGTGIVIDGPNGKIELWIPNANTLTLPLGCLVYDLKVTNSQGMVERLFGGTFNVKEMVTQ